MKNSKLYLGSVGILVCILTFTFAFTHRPLVNKSLELKANNPSAHQLNAPTKKFLSKKGEMVIAKSLINPLSNKVLGTSRSMSRCPSGVNYQVNSVPVASNPYFEGEVTGFIGCNSKNFCTFRIDENETNLEIYDKATSQYISPENWFAKDKPWDATGESAAGQN